MQQKLDIIATKTTTNSSQLWFNSCKALALWKIDLNKTGPLVIKVFSMRFISVIKLKYNRI